jgi:hypothetical protein
MESSEFDTKATQFDDKHGAAVDEHGQPSVYFDGKLRIFSHIDLKQLQADVLVNFCTSNIMCDDDVFLNVHELAGDELSMLWHNSRA